ncbi:forkhead box protein N1 isoform X1 [Trachypithecus francoisi]|uniref:forkhead box protein N1 isoform X1 n=2 Tax=Trachypithecus francoisi TaxID=54180 RepID=UPI00141BD3A0|nr:forkhead box protein N1 isoform X1 [Trachypithecus francoisi]
MTPRSGDGGHDPELTDWVMVSLPPPQSDVTLPGPTRLEGERQGDLMQAPGLPGSPAPQSKHAGFSCSSFVPNGPPERTPSLPPHSPRIASPGPEQVQGHCPAGRGPGPFRLSPSDKYPGFGFEEAPASSPGRFLKGSHVPFHPYKRPFHEDVFPEAETTLALNGHSFKTPGPLEAFEEIPVDVAEAEAFLPGFSAEAWCNGLPYPSQEHGPQVLQGSEVKVKSPVLESGAGMFCYQPPLQHMYCSSQPPFQQYSPGGGSYPVPYLGSSHYPYQRMAPQASTDGHQPLFPKPIYSYSILIFMALKNSKTGSLPVSEIYNFMTEHFPYFKTAPDGWKNSVRHNLSLNKCFEKVENKSGSSSRKGCLWALNPAKIDKMQEELQKWKRKDPIAVRKSMAKPEELDSLIGDKREKLGSPILGCPPPGLAGSGPIRPLAPPAGLSPPLHSLHPAPGPIPGKNPLQDLLVGHAPSCYGQTYLHLSPGLAPPGPPQPLFPQPDGHLELRAQPGTPQDSPLPAHTPPSHSAKLLAEPSPARTVHDTLLPDGDLGTDLDAINPSLTDFDFQGNLWEQLKDDSLALDPLVLVTSSPTSSSMPPPQPPPHGFPPGPCLTETGSGAGDLASPGSGGSGALGDLHLTTLYSAFMELEPTPPPASAGPSVYLSPSSKPMALA